MRHAVRLYQGAPAIFLIASSFTASHAALAQETSAQSSSGGIEEIVVSARRREESLQDVPASVSALSGDFLRAANVVDLTNVSAKVPSVQVLRTLTPDTFAMNIRGQITSNPFDPLQDPAVGLYFDDVYVARNAGGLLSFLDVERVEVLKGPQGTLYGRNTPGGAVNVITKRPEYELEGNATLSYQTGNDVTASGVLNLHVVDDLMAVRFSALYGNSDGLYNNSFNGNDLDHSEQQFYRASVRLDPASNVRVLLQGDYSKQKFGAFPGYLDSYSIADGVAPALAVGFANGATSIPDAIPLGAQIIQDMIATQRRAGAHDVSLVRSRVDGSSDPDPFIDNHTYGVSLRAEYDVGASPVGDLTLKSISAYRDAESEGFYNFDNVAFNFVETGIRQTSHQFTQELQVLGAAERLNWVAGAFYFHERSFQDQPALAVPGLGVPVTAVRPTADNTSYSVFANVSYDFTDRFAMTAGGRWNDDRKEFEVRNVVLPSGTCALPADLLDTPGVCLIERTYKKKIPVYSISAQYKITPDVMVYLSNSKGYRSGGFNPSPTAERTLVPFGPEKVNATELGLKADFFGQRLRTNLAAFYSDRKGVQTAKNGLDDKGTPETSDDSVAIFVDNSASGDVTGFEAEITAVPLEWLTLEGALGLMDTEIKGDPALTKAVLTPETTYSLAATLQHAVVPGRFDGMFRLQYAHSSSKFEGNFIEGCAPPSCKSGTSTDVDPISGVATVTEGGFPRIPSYGTLDATLKITELKTGFSLSLYGTNLTDEDYVIRKTGVGGLGLVTANIGPRRVIGARFDMPFK